MSRLFLCFENESIKQINLASMEIEFAGIPVIDSPGKWCRSGARYGQVGDLVAEVIGDEYPSRRLDAPVPVFPKVRVSPSRVFTVWGFERTSNSVDSTLTS